MEINPWSVWPKSSETWLLFNCNLNLPFWPGSCIIPQNAAYIPITVSNHTGDYYSSWKVDNYETGREKASVLRLYLTRLHLATNVRWRFGEDRPSIFSPMWLWMFCRLFVVASTLTVYTHMLDLERSHRKWCHGPKMSCLLPACHKAGIFFQSIFTSANLFSVLFPDSVSDPSPPTSFSALLPTHLQKKEEGFLFSTRWKFSPTLWPSLPLPFLFAFLYLPPASICLAWSPPQAAPRQSPLEESCSEDVSLNQQQDCNAFDSVPFDGGPSSASDSRLNYHFS